MTKRKQDPITHVDIKAERFDAIGRIIDTTDIQINRVGDSIYFWIKDTNGKITRSYTFSASELAKLMYLTRARDFVRHDESIRLANVGTTNESKDQTHR